MLYRVRAGIVEDKMKEYFEKLSNGTIEEQEPEGPEIVASMRRARLTAPGVIEWSETCYCPTPLAHERSTVYDHFLSGIEAEEISSRPEIEGEPFWNYLAKLTAEN